MKKEKHITFETTTFFWLYYSVVLIISIFEVINWIFRIYTSSLTATLIIILLVFSIIALFKFKKYPKLTKIIPISYIVYAGLTIILGVVYMLLSINNLFFVSPLTPIIIIIFNTLLAGLSLYLLNKYDMKNTKPTPMWFIITVLVIDIILLIIDNVPSLANSTLIDAIHFPVSIGYILLAIIMLIIFIVKKYDTPGRLISTLVISESLLGFISALNHYTFQDNIQTTLMGNAISIILFAYIIFILFVKNRH